jgi:signal transduction histidine kinase
MSSLSHIFLDDPIPEGKPSLSGRIMPYSGSEKEIAGDEISGEIAADELHAFLPAGPDPVFLVNRHSGKILMANAAAVLGNGGIQVSGRLMSQVVRHRESLADGTELVYFNRSWRVEFEQTIFRKNSDLVKVTLMRHPMLPGTEQIESARDMIAVMLHRFRSPMTGMQGYLELMMNDVESGSSDTESSSSGAESGSSDAESVKKQKQRLEVINSGMNQLNSMLDELEKLQSRITVTGQQNIHPEAIIQEIVSDLSPGIKKRISVGSSFESGSGKKKSMAGCRDKLRTILDILVTNALEHTSGKNREIRIELVSPYKIEITNFGDPVSGFMAERMFMPFMTNKAQNLGIGLTRAHLLASYLGATLLLTRNSAEEGITMTLFLPPESTQPN